MVGRTNARAASGVSLSLVVTVDSGAAVTATNGSKTVTGTSSSGTCTLTLPEAGTWTVSATKSGATSWTRTVSVTDTYATTLDFVSETLNNNDWSKIRTASDRGTAADYWEIGDRKEVVLNGSVGCCTFSSFSTYAFIIGFNHNSGYEGGNRIHFQFGKTAVSSGTDVCFIDSRNNTTGSSSAFRMNTTNTNSGGWSSSHMRQIICGTSLTSYSGTFIAVLPSDLRSVLKTVTKYTDNTGNKTTAASAVTATTDVIFLLSEWEVFGARTYANTTEKNYQAQYAYYSAGNSKVKYKHTSIDSANGWFLRSTNSSATSTFVSVNSDGNTGVNSAYTSCGFAPGFCV